MKLLNNLILLFILYVPLLANNDAIKIVYNSGTPPLKFTDINKNPNGMLIDIWKLWAKKNNQKIEFIEASWKDTIQMIKDGRADIHAGIYYTKDRDQFLDYTSKPLYTNKKYFFYHKSIGEIFKLDELKPYVIGVDNGYAITFMKENFPNFHWVEFESSDSANNAFFDNEFKVVLSSLSTFYYYLKKNNFDEDLYRYNNITYAYSKKYYGAVKEGNQKLLEQIEKGFENINKSELNNIELKWTKELKFSDFDKSTTQILFTKDEFKYLDKKKEIKMCVDPSWLPFEKIEDGIHKGIVADIYYLIKKELPIPINLISTKTWSDSLASAKLRQCDILSAVSKTPSREKYMNFSKPFMVFPEVLVTREKEPFIVNFEDVISEKIGVVKDSAIAELIKNRYPDINLIETKNLSEGLFKVGSGELFGFVNTMAALSYEMAKNGMTNLKIAAKVGIDYKISVASRNDEPELTEVFNKIIDKMDKKQINNIKDSWLKVKVQELIDYTLIYKILAWFIAIIIVIFYWNRKLKQEIDERTKVEEELNKFLQIIEQSQVSIMLTNLQGVILYVNPYCSFESGYSKEELIGNKPNIFKSGKQEISFYKTLWKEIKAGNTWQGEFLNKKKNGDFFWESAVIAPIFDDDKNIKFFASIKQDITARIQVQNELIIAQKEANQANAAKSDFLAKMSHEIRTPMNAVLGMLYLLGKTSLKENQKDYVKKAHAAANSLLGIINDILDFSKIEANKLEIKNSEFNIYELANEVMSIMSVKAEDNDIELLTYFDKKAPIYIFSDRLRLAQILNNLISNAVKFTKNGEVYLNVDIIEKHSDGEVVLKFCVKDTGIGISKENQKKLFKEFAQVDDSATRSFHGTGLGLAISKKLANLLGGDIWIEDSQKNMGTTICFTIKAKLATKKEHIGFIFPNSKSHLKVLVVDDNNLASEVLSSIIDSFGYEVKSIDSGYKAIEVLQKESFDLVFLDYKMPKLNGIETYTKYKEILKEKTPKTVITTAYINDIIQKNIDELGILGYLQKPITPSTLYDKIIEITCSDEENDNNINPNGKKLFENENILLVEDNELNREFATIILKDFGLNIDIAVDGVEAIEKIVSQKYKLVLMDIQMPRLDGLSATKRIRSLNEEYFKTLPIIALSANAMVSDKEKSLEAGINEHITKPINPDNLFNVLKKYIPQKKQSNQKTEEKSEYKYINKLNSDIFDIKEAMNRISGNEDVYVKILEQFSTNYKDSLEYIEKLLRNNELELLEKKIHEIKGIAGNIAAKKLFKSLSKINAKLINGQTLNIELIEKFKLQFTEVMEEINKIDYSCEEKTKEFDKKTIVELLFDLHNSLESDIVHCEEIIKELLLYKQSSKYDTMFKELESSLSDFDTDKAKEVIDKLLEVLDSE